MYIKFSSMRLVSINIQHRAYWIYLSIEISLLNIFDRKILIVNADENIYMNVIDIQYLKFDTFCPFMFMLIIRYPPWVGCSRNCQNANIYHSIFLSINVVLCNMTSIEIIYEADNSMNNTITPYVCLSLGVVFNNMLWPWP